MRPTRNRTDLLNCALLAALTLVLCWFFVLRLGEFGSKVDWISQHSVLPDYFRQLFYQTGDFFPDFAKQLGGGQNIYHFAYYGLFSPVILPSYLLPFVEMGHYIMVVSILGLAASCMLLYLWLSARFSKQTAFTAACFFLLASPMLYHSYNQLMFINYMPFLCLGLIGTDRFFSQKKAGLLTVSTVLMILTSFYFSIGGMAALVLYGISVYLEQTKRVSIASFLKTGLSFLAPLLTAVLISSFLLVPTFLALTSGRGSDSTLSAASLLIPDLPLERLLYSPYGLGLSALTAGALPAALASGKKPLRFLSISLLILLAVPLFGYILNGGLYLKDKAFLPLLPLLVYLLAWYLHLLSRQEIRIAWAAICHVIVIGFIWFSRTEPFFAKYRSWILVDAVLILVCFLLYTRFRRISIMTVPSLVLLLVFGQLLNQKADKAVSADLYASVTDSSIQSLIEEIPKQEAYLYRTEQTGSLDLQAANLNRVHHIRQSLSTVYSSVCNQEYAAFQSATFQTDQPFRNCLMESSANPLFLKFMGVRYLIGTDTPAGYEKISSSGHLNLYRTNHAAPLGYVTDKLLSESDYKKLRFPHNQTALQTTAVVSDSSISKSGSTESRPLTDDTSAVTETSFSLPAYEGTDGTITPNDSGYDISLKKPVTLSISLNSQDTDYLYFLRFSVKNHRPGQDVAVTLGDQRNKLSAKDHPYYNHNENFTFVTGISRGQREVRITFGKGKYTIQNLQSFTGTDTADTGTGLWDHPFSVTGGTDTDNQISGKINADTDGYFITSIPYDKGFSVLVDGKQTKYEKVNTAFLGFPLSKGTHEISITYHAKGTQAGKLFSLAGLLLFGFLILYRRYCHSRSASVIGG